MGVIAGAALVVFQILNKRMRLGLAGGLKHLFVGRFGAAVSDVVHGRAVEHRGFLRDHADAAPQAFLRHGAGVGPVDADRAAFGLVQPQQQRHEGRFPRARCADDADFLPRFDVQVHAGNPAHIAPVGKVHIFQNNSALSHVQIAGVGVVFSPVARRQPAPPP